MKGSDGQGFLREITTASWNDDGRRAAELFAWIPRDATSTDQASAVRAGQAAHAIASFLADGREAIKDAPANPALWQSFSHSLIPYLGAMVGDGSGTAGFAPLDGLNSAMPKTVSLFAAVAKDPPASQEFIAAAAARAHTYEGEFAKTALAQPFAADVGEAQQELQRAARLRAVVDASTRVINPKADIPWARRMTEVAYRVASLTARPGDPHINGEFFMDGRLMPPNQIAPADWSIYDVQLSAYLTDAGRVNAAIRQFGHTYDEIVKGQ
ncbi:hypothetical protein [Mycobacterium sp. MMS18-G62]